MRMALRGRFLRGRNASLRSICRGIGDLVGRHYRCRRASGLLRIRRQRGPVNVISLMSGLEIVCT